MIRIRKEELIEMVERIMEKVGCEKEKAKNIAEILVEADMRGIHSHGVARVKRYINHIKDGIIDPKGEPEIVKDTQISALIDGNNGIGQYISVYATNLAIKKAKESGIGLISVRNSNHFGIAGYYAEKIAKEGYIGISLTNSAPLVVHTFSKEALLGTNPISIAFPLKGKNPILIDMATSVVPRGKLEVYSRQDKKIPKGWAVDEKGITTEDPNKVLKNMKERKGGGLLPLGGEGEEYGGHKGYGLALIVELFTGGISLGSFSYDTYKGQGKISHFFGAIDIELFEEKERVMEHVRELVEKLKSAKKAEGKDYIYIHGEKEYMKREEAIKYGVEIEEKVYEELMKFLNEL